MLDICTPRIRTAKISNKLFAGRCVLVRVLFNNKRVFDPVMRFGDWDGNSGRGDIFV